MEQYAKLSDAFTPKRIEKLVAIYLVALRDSLIGYRCELLLLLGLFRICASSQLFKERISEEFQDK